MNNKLLLVVVVVLLLAGGWYFFMRQPTVPATTEMTPTNVTPVVQDTGVAAGQNSVTIKGFAFSPATLTVKVGDTVTWTNQDTAGHSATADDGSFDTGVLATGQSGTATFSQAGTFTYHCSVHPNMKATIVVQ